MSDLERFRDHCREMATIQHAEDCYGAQRVTKVLLRNGRASDLDHDLSCADETAHDAHEWIGDHGFDWFCPGVCGGCVSDADRALWIRLADEIDGYLATDDEPLWADS